MDFNTSNVLKRSFSGGRVQGGVLRESKGSSSSCKDHHHERKGLGGCRSPKLRAITDYCENDSTLVFNELSSVDVGTPDFLTQFDVTPVVEFTPNVKTAIFVCTRIQTPSPFSSPCPHPR
eukprot:TRINITY_DN28236_c0_g1_i1.p1 TRINITY_DN28236_c0_g1~~TRINITY_DN28236_c0_g1_i1.p1  ORF type:complete len:120 (-),score=27.44 TRINITY_DN28236_c0_g1_i1:84-443(-)